MPTCDFHTLGDDCRAVLDFVFAQDGWVLCELGSRVDSRVRAFRSTSDVARAFRLGRTPYFGWLEKDGTVRNSHTNHNSRERARMG